MKAFTLKTVLVSVDKSSKTINKINKSFNKMSRNITLESKTAKISFKSFAKSVGMQSKRAVVSLNNMNASVNRVFRGMSKKLGSFGLLIGFTAIFAGVKGIINKMADFEQANASLSSVLADATGSELKALSEDAKRLGAITAKSATEVVGLQEAFGRLGFAQKEIINMTGATISGSVAMNGELDQTAELVGAMVRSFDDFESVNAPEIIDQMTKATQKSALNFEKLQTSLPIVAGAANAAKIPFTKLLSLLGKLSDAGIDASSSSTALRNIFLESAKQGLSYDQILTKIVNSQDSLTAANDEFGKRAAVSGVVLASKLRETADLETEIINSQGAARIAADKQLNTLTGSVTILKSAWEGWVLSLDDGNGKFTTFLKTSVKVVTEILSIATGTQKANEKLNDAELRIRKIAERSMFFLKVLKWITIAFIAFKAVVILSNAALVAYNIVMGITGALFGTMTKSIALNAAALIAYKIVTGIATAAQWLLNTAFYGFPLVWILAAIAAVVAGIVYLVKHWDELSGKLTKDWNRITSTFKKDGLGGIFKMWGKDLLIYVLQPLKGVLAIIAKISGGKYGLEAFKKIEKLEAGLLVDVGRGDEIVKKENKVSMPKNIMSQSLTKEDKLTVALNKNSEVLEKNTELAKKEWSGKFYTSVLKDANISENSSSVVQRGLANEVLVNESNITSEQQGINSNIPQSVVSNVASNNRNSRSVNGTVTVNIVDKTGGNFALEVEGTGVNVVTTGNA